MATRGYAKWNPNNDARYWVSAVAKVLEEYGPKGPYASPERPNGYWPLSVRQVFYRIVAVNDYEKSESAYSKLTGLIGRARRAGYLPWSAIRDGGQGRALGAHYYESQEEFEESLKDAADSFRLDRQSGQVQVVELWCEAGGMVPILSDIGDPYSCRINTGGGYDSVTAKHNLATRVRGRAERGLKTLILHVGDFDGSGEDMCNVLREDAGEMVATQVMQSIVSTDKFGYRDWLDAPPWLWEDLHDREEGISQRFVDYVYGWFEVERVALTGQQVVDRNVETAPPKKTDSRSRGFIEANRDIVDQLGTEDISAQLEALTPPELEALITETIEAHLDLDRYAEVLDEEEAIRTDLREKLNG
jgi:hypothetical protein